MRKQFEEIINWYNEELKREEERFQNRMNRLRKTRNALMDDMKKLNSNDNSKSILTKKDG